MKYTLWFTGRPCAGKTTLANAFYSELKQPDENYKTRDIFLLDGDQLRGGLNEGLGFSVEGRRRNLTNAAHVSKIINKAGLDVFATFITPTNEMRNVVGKIIGDGFRLVYVNSSLEVCEKRDVKGMYELARRGDIKDFTGIDPNAPFEPPLYYNLELKTDKESIAESVRKLKCYWGSLNK